MVEHVMGLPVPALLVVAAVVLVLESGSPLGVLLPGSPMLLALGLLSRQGAVLLVRRRRAARVARSGAV
ncbi:hypothetical protein [Saccharopolyspora gregorii]|uniref:Uncharacterized protein n=1 Tax=Saccharopolyspora gregorii TaxID=33914 RepID=A0ABP6RY96_9PSEU